MHRLLAIIVPSTEGQRGRYVSKHKHNHAEGLCQPDVGYNYNTYTIVCTAIYCTPLDEPNWLKVK